jgi:hypothetical protein
MKYEDIQIGQNLNLRGNLHGAYPCEVVGIDPRRISSWGFGGNESVQIRVVLYPGNEAQDIWVAPERLMIPGAR